MMLLCKKCGAECGKGLFCPKCGSDLERNNEVPEPETIQDNSIIPELKTLFSNQLEISQKLNSVSDEIEMIKKHLKLDQSDTGTPEEKPLTPSEWLIACGITIRNYHEHDAADAVYDRLAKFFGDRYDNLSGFYEIIKRSLPTGRRHALLIMPKLGDCRN